MISVINQTNHSTTERYKIFSQGHILYIKYRQWKILQSGLSDYACNYEGEECPRNRFFCWRRDLVVLVPHEKPFGVDVGPVFNSPSGEQQPTCGVNYIGENILGLTLTKLRWNSVIQISNDGTPWYCPFANVLPVAFRFQESGLPEALFDD